MLPLNGRDFQLKEYFRLDLRLVNGIWRGQELRIFSENGVYVYVYLSGLALSIPSNSFYMYFTRIHIIILPKSSFLKLSSKLCSCFKSCPDSEFFFCMQTVFCSFRSSRQHFCQFTLALPACMWPDSIQEAKQELCRSNAKDGRPRKDG